MQKRGIVRAIAFLLAFLMLSGAILSLVGILFSSASDELSDWQSKLDKLTKQQADLEKQIQSTGTQKKTEMQKKSTLESEINKFSERITILNEIISELDAQIDDKQHESDTLQQQIDHQIMLYGARIRENHESGRSGYLDMLFGASSMAEYLTKTDRNGEIALYDEQLITTLRENRAAILDAKAEIEYNRTTQAALQKEVSQLRVQREGHVNEVNTTIKKLNNDEAALKKAYEEGEAEQNRITAEIQKILLARLGSDYVGGNLGWPTPGYKSITDTYGMRIHPITKTRKMHTGIDIAAKGGTQILASNAGYVVKAEYNSAWGNYILIDHGGGVSTFYAHMQNAASVSVGSTVAKGQRIGLVGSTGLSTGNHLHFEVWMKGNHTDPLGYVTPS